MFAAFLCFVFAFEVFLFGTAMITPPSMEPPAVGEKRSDGTPELQANIVASNPQH